MDPIGSDLEGVQDRIGYRFRNIDLLQDALTHRSYSHEASRGAGAPTPHYERLEFLGDALLGFIAADELYKIDQGADEGILTRRKQMIVGTQTLATVAVSLDLGREMRLGRGEQAAGGGQKASLLADIFEAVLAAVYLDGGIRQARSFVRRHLRAAILETTGKAQVIEDFKTRFQELVQSQLRVTPIYRIVSSTGPDHRQLFSAVVQVGAEVIGSGQGTSRKKAEQAAALDALNHWKQE